MKQISFTIIVLFIIFTTIPAQEKLSTPVEQRADDLKSLFNPHPQNYDHYFSNTFLSQVHAIRLTALFANYYLNLGKCIKVEKKKLSNNYSGNFNFIFEKNMSVPINLTVDSLEPHLITGLWFTGSPVSIAGSFDDIIKEFKSMPGESSLLVINISGNKTDTLAAYNSGRELAIGSTFKLYILSELLRTINNGSNKWTSVTQLQSGAVSIGSGIIRNWPVGSTLTLDTLTALMISQSDNTAADNLLYFLGRKNVEKMLSVTGHSKPELDIPFLSTSEMFKLKGERSAHLADEYLAKTAEERREILTNVIPQISIDSLTFTGEPIYIDSIEWFASAGDLCNVMNWLRLNTLPTGQASQSEPGAEVRRILSINRGLTISKDKWKYVGFKGGSEAGVLNMTYLLQSADGEWYALSAGWNNTNAPVDEVKLEGLVGRAIELIK